MSTHDRVLEALRARAGSTLSGEALARELGVSRVAISKHVARLRAEGYAIESAPGSGYCLTESPDLPLPAEVEPLLDSSMWRLTGGPVTGSTNDDARALARAGAEEGTVVLAGRQTAGRGRFGRVWASPPGGVYLSALLRPRVAVAETGPLALVVGLGVVRGLEAVGISAKLKWPNDVLLGSCKVAGILLEMSAEADRVEWVVAGVGVNVRPGDERDPQAAYLSDESPSVRSARVAAAVLDGVSDAYVEWSSRGFTPLLPEYERRLSLLGGTVEVRDMTGKIRADGIVKGVDHDGRLLVAEGADIRALAAGEVTLGSRRT